MEPLRDAPRLSTDGSTPSLLTMDTVRGAHTGPAMPLRAVHVALFCHNLDTVRQLGGPTRTSSRTARTGLASKRYRCVTRSQLMERGAQRLVTSEHHVSHTLQVIAPLALVWSLKAPKRRTMRPVTG